MKKIKKSKRQSRMIKIPFRSLRLKIEMAYEELSCLRAALLMTDDYIHVVPCLLLHKSSSRECLFAYYVSFSIYSSTCVPWMVCDWVVQDNNNTNQANDGEHVFYNRTCD